MEVVSNWLEKSLLLSVNWIAFICLRFFDLGAPQGKEERGLNTVVIPETLYLCTFYRVIRVGS